MVTTIQKGQIESITASSTVQNVFGTDTGATQQRFAHVNIISGTDVYWKIIASTETLTGTVSSTDYHGVLSTGGNTYIAAHMAPNEILVIVTTTSASLNAREVIEVG